jgi:hypothetical protein
MPLPLLAGIPALLEGIAAFMESRMIVYLGERFTAIVMNTVWPLIKSAIAWALGSIAAQEFMQGSINAIIVKEVRERAGIELDPDQPLSKQSLAVGIGTKFGLELDPVEPFTRASIGVAVGRRIGLQLDPSDPFSKASLATAVGNKIGLELDANDPFSKESFGNAVSFKLGLNAPFRDISNREFFLEDLGQGITNVLNNRLGTSFVRLYPPNEAMISDFGREMVVQLDKAMNGQPSLIKGPTVTMLITRMRRQTGDLLPMTLDQSEKAIRQRAASRKYYDSLAKEGYTRKWVRPRTDNNGYDAFDPAI